ncbi:hypothetical protein GCM10011349_03410 [Novosphingobium indicum]|uniref:Transposase DDE domain-containing protein n=1 Tax=Novosphingobium indicum TaxID=462949 RepID=A0ABQ2JAI4_9SPHN|nr:hypothetical protein GCM10011349_03410 [Novosphingobium indicum]
MAAAHGCDEPGEGHFRGIRHAAEHAFAAKDPVEADSVETADESRTAAIGPVLPAFHRMGLTHLVQVFVAGLDAMADPAAPVVVLAGRLSWCGAGLHNLRKGGIAGHLEAAAAQGAGQRSREMEAVERKNCAQARFHPEDFRVVAAVRHRENPGAVCEHEKIGLDQVDGARGMHSGCHSK